MVNPRSPLHQDRQPILNVPTTVAAIVAVLLAVQLGRTQFLGDDADWQMVQTFAFIPARVVHPVLVAPTLPGGQAAAVGSFLTYAFLHADWAHLIFNSLWLVAFGSPVAWRFGGVRFLILSAIGAVAGALIHLAFYPEGMVPLVGASAAISAYMAAASRFVFSAGGPMLGFQGSGLEGYRQPAPPWSSVIRDRRVVIFVAIWFGLNIVFGPLGGNNGLTTGAIAWEAHIGGFIAGLLLFPLLDPIGTRRS